MVVKMVVKNRRRSLPLCSPVVLVSPVAERDGVREPRHTRGDLRAASSNAGFGHITSHVLRKTRATMLGHAGLSARAIAAQPEPHSGRLPRSQSRFHRRRGGARGAPTYSALP